MSGIANMNLYDDQWTDDFDINVLVCLSVTRKSKISENPLANQKRSVLFSTNQRLVGQICAKAAQVGHAGRLCI